MESFRLAQLVSMVCTYASLLVGRALMRERMLVTIIPGRSTSQMSPNLQFADSINSTQ